VQAETLDNAGLTLAGLTSAYRSLKGALV